MKSLKNRSILGTTAILTILTTACASSLRQSPSLEQRKLRIDVERGDFKYQTTKCKGIWPFRKCWVETETYNFCESREVRQRLDDMEFTLGRW